MTLNSNQYKAVIHNKGPMMVLSGPGSGKTTVIIHRIKNLIENLKINPNKILVITFTKSACEEMKDRFNKMCNKHYNVTFNTFHAYFFRIIRDYYQYDYKNNILDEDEKINIIKKIVSDNNIFFNNEEEFIQSIISEISLLKNELINYKLFNSRCINSSTFILIYEQYEKIKAEQRKIDFDDMLIQCYHLLKKDKVIRNSWIEKYDYILIDEYQDSNKVQYECIKMLVSSEKNIFVVGDDDQSIYGFRGSSPKFLHKFYKEFENSKKIILNTNYRSTEQIISLCNKVISENNNRFQKNIIGTNKEGKTPILLKSFDISEEAKKVVEKINKLKEDYPLEEIAVIYRTNLQARAIAEILRDFNISYQLKDNMTNIYNHFVGKDIIAYLKLATNNLDNDSFFRIANKPKRFLNKDMLKEVIELCKDETSALEYLYCKVDLKSWQTENVNELLFHLGNIKNKKPYDAIKYIIGIVGYEKHIEDYANFRHIGTKGLIEILNELLESAKGYNNIQEYLNHIDLIKDEALKKYKTENIKEGVVLTTMHSAKGLEFKVVFVIGCIEGVIPHERSKNLLEIEEERRLFYVALTRAKELLYISLIETKYEQKVKPSRFIKNLIKVKR